MKKRIHITLDDNLLARLDALAEEQSRTRNNMVEVILKDAMRQTKKTLPEQD